MSSSTSRRPWRRCTGRSRKSRSANGRRAWGPSLVALFTAEREFLPGEDAAVGRSSSANELAEIRLRALEAYAAAALGTGGTELSAAVRAGRKLVRQVPLRETGYQVLMRALDRQGNIAEALVLYASLCRVLRDELGVDPSGRDPGHLPGTSPIVTWRGGVAATRPSPCRRTRPIGDPRRRTEVA